MSVHYTIELLETRLGQPQIIGKDKHGADFWSSIDRQPAQQSHLYLTWTGLAGDQPTQTRPKTAKEGGNGQLHGGNYKAVYVYPAGHYAHWLAELGEAGLAGRSLGENLSIRGATESNVHIGDRWQWGDAIVEVSKVRAPCNTLVIYFGGQKMIKHMAANGLCGWYLRVLKPGLVPTSGTINVFRQNPDGETVADHFAAKMGTGKRA